MAVAAQPTSTPKGAEASYAARWQRTLVLALPFGVLAFVAGWALDGPSGQATAFDAVVYPVMAVTLLALHVVLAVRREALTLVVLTIVGGTSVFLLSKLVFLLFLDMGSVQVQAELTESFFWVPVIYLLSFVLPHVSLGRQISVAFTASILLVTLAYAFAPDLPARSLGVVFALIQLNLANGVLLALTQAFIGFKEAYVRTQARVETAERFASIDPLTELPNRFALQERLTSALAEARASRERLGVLFIDVDGFKVLNDTVGHEAGDELLRQLADRLRRVVRKNDFIARISGDEFVLLVAGLDEPKVAAFVAQKLQADLVEPFHVLDQAFRVTVSIGISVFPDDAGDPEGLLRHADSAMYRVKRSGKNGVQEYRGETDAQLERQRALERDLRSALQGDQLSLVYQPLHDLHTGEARKFEALLRWSHPSWGHVSPTEFIPLAEQSGQIVQLGTWVLNQACKQVRTWQRSTQERIQVCVNVSPLQFAQPNFYDSVVAALENHGLMPEALELELTESIVLHGVDHVASTLDRLRRLGVGLAIDDFGTGYSSLAYLRDLPIDTIKIDRSFVKDLGSPRKGPQFALALVEAITGIARYLDLSVVAEGIETRAQVELLKSLGCHQGQGFYFAQPMTPELVEVYLRPGDPLRTDERAALFN
ncbi:MAG: putative bifunctional diguanylate cyclase/phosphodiesterase [Trueperaceae bacterium]